MAPHADNFAPAVAIENGRAPFGVAVMISASSVVYPLFTGRAIRFTSSRLPPARWTMARDNPRDGGAG